jgi:uncharacterized protein (DUF1330 family)
MAHDDGTPIRLQLAPRVDSPLVHHYGWRVPAYVIVSVDITDPEGYQSYLPGAGAAVQAHGGRLLAADPDTALLEGSAGQMTVVLEFPDKGTAEAWYTSPEYQGVVHLRHRSADGTAVIADGFVPTD